MKVLMIATDRRAFNPHSDVAMRLKEYGELTDELAVVVFSNKKYPKEEIQLTEKTTVYPTYSFSRWFYVVDAYRAGKKIFSRWKREKDLLVSAQDPFETGIVALRLARKYHVALQVQVHTDMLSPFFKRESIINRMRVRLGLHILKRADGIRTVSERIMKNIKGTLPFIAEKIAVLPIFVDRVASKASLEGKIKNFSPIFLVASRLSREKNISLAIHAFKKILVKNPHALLFVVGDGPEKENIENVVKNLAIEKNVMFEPWTESVAPYYKVAHALLITSNYEGYGRTIIEALGEDCPVIATDVGIAPDVIRHPQYGRIIPVGDEDALVKAMEEFTSARTPKLSPPFNLATSKSSYLAEYRNLFEEAIKHHEHAQSLHRHSGI